MIKEFAKGVSNDYEQETPLDGHNIVELTNKNEDYEQQNKKKCC